MRISGAELSASPPYGDHRRQPANNTKPPTPRQAATGRRDQHRPVPKLNSRLQEPILK